jgi:hypothetical protein
MQRMGWNEVLHWTPVPIKDGGLVQGNAAAHAKRS